MSTKAVDIGTLIGAIPGVYGGRLLLLRSGFPMIQLVADYQSGMRIEAFKDAYPHIDEESLYAGIAYYLGNLGTPVRVTDAVTLALSDHRLADKDNSF